MLSLSNKKIIVLLIVVLLCVFIGYNIYNKELFGLNQFTDVNSFFGTTKFNNLPTSGFYYIKINNSNNYLNYSNQKIDQNYYSFEPAYLNNQRQILSFFDKITGTLNTTNNNKNISNIFYIDPYGQILTNDKKNYLVSFIGKESSTGNTDGYIPFFLPMIFNPLLSDIPSNITNYEGSYYLIANPFIYLTNLNAILSLNVINKKQGYSLGNTTLDFYFTGLNSNGKTNLIYGKESSFNNLFTLINAPDPSKITTTQATTTQPKIIRTIPTLPPLITVASQLPTQAPIKTNYSVINYANDIMKEDNITSIAGCETIYDDNILVKNIGYNNCSFAYADYITKGLDPTEKYDYSKSLEEMCPITTRSPKYLECMKALYGKFHQANIMLNTVGTNISNIINQRLTDRQNILNELNNNLINNISNEVPTKPQNYTNTMDYNLLENNKYFKERNQPFITTSQNNQQINENFENTQTTTINPTNTVINTAINFLGSYKQTKGQFIILDDIKLNLSINELTVEKDGEIIAILSVTNLLSSTKYPDTIEIALNSLDIKTDIDTWLPIQNIFKTLGIVTPCILYLTMDKFISTENITHITYRLFNNSHDTIMYLQKID